MFKTIVQSRFFVPMRVHALYYCCPSGPHSAVKVTVYRYAMKTAVLLVNYYNGADRISCASNRILQMHVRPKRLTEPIVPK
jgi:hypothetical protein